jgi:hypothetical protein
MLPSSILLWAALSTDSCSYPKSWKEEGSLLLVESMVNTEVRKSLRYWFARVGKGGATEDPSRSAAELAPRGTSYFARTDSMY